MVGSLSSTWAIEVQGLTKAFALRKVLRGIDLRVRRGGFLTIFGPNGSGKTTLLKILSTLIKPTAGRICISGYELGEDASAIRRIIGVVSHNTLLYDDLTPYENLRFYGRMYDVPQLEERIASVIAQVGLASRLHDRVRTLSRGMQQRLSIARALLHNPSILLLDEPETGLDPQATAALGEILQGMKAGERTVVMTTHNLERGLSMGDHVVILANGTIAYEELERPLDMADFRGTYYRYTGVRS
ncbi:MAG: heme ABC exporter ATP-binding protein CcmA [Chloroflexi bacterium]|nr:heme ABC exporter ATP-binding protein CcmA [Chloroflexota bacterium]